MKKCEVRLNWELSEKDCQLWNATFQCVERVDSNTNNFIDKIDHRFELIKIEHDHEHDDMDIQSLKNILSGQLNNTPTLLEYARTIFDIK